VVGSPLWEVPDASRSRCFVSCPSCLLEAEIGAIYAEGLKGLKQARSQKSPILMRFSCVCSKDDGIQKAGGCSTGRRNRVGGSSKTTTTVSIATGTYRSRFFRDSIIAPRLFTSELSQQDPFPLFASRLHCDPAALDRPLCCRAPRDGYFPAAPVPSRAHGFHRGRTVFASRPTNSLLGL
jgi:hypothetical protein